MSCQSKYSKASATCWRHITLHALAHTACIAHQAKVEVRQKAAAQLREEFRQNLARAAKEIMDANTGRGISPAALAAMQEKIMLKDEAVHVARLRVMQLRAKLQALRDESRSEVCLLF